MVMEHSLGQARDSKRFFYGWYMVSAGASLQFLLAGLMTQSFGAYVAVLQAERGWSKTALSGAAALQQMEAAILGPLLGWLIDRFGPQGIIRFGIVVFGCGLMLLSQTDSLLAFYGAFLVIAVGASCCGLFPVNVALIHCFERWRAPARGSRLYGRWPAARRARRRGCSGCSGSTPRLHRQRSAAHERFLAALARPRLRAFRGARRERPLDHAHEAGPRLHARAGVLRLHASHAQPDRRRVHRLADRRPLREAPHRRLLHADAHDGAPAPHLRAERADGARLRRAARRGMGPARAVHAGA